MGNRENNSLESIIRAAKEMARLRNQERARPAAEKEAQVNIIRQDILNSSMTLEELLASEQTEEDTASPEAPEEAPEDLLSAAESFSNLLQTAGVHFLEFSVAFLSMVKRHYQQSGNDIRANSLAFFALIALDSWAADDYTMSDLAEKLQVPKQQLTKLINDLEEKGLVERIHDTENRRRVYIRICEPGRILMEDVKQEMLQSTLHGLRSYSGEELKEMDSCICRLTELMEKFNTEAV